VPAKSVELVWLAVLVYVRLRCTTNFSRLLVVSMSFTVHFGRFSVASVRGLHRRLADEHLGPWYRTAFSCRCRYNRRCMGSYSSRRHWWRHFRFRRRCLVHFGLQKCICKRNLRLTNFCLSISGQCTAMNKLQVSVQCVCLGQQSCTAIGSRPIRLTTHEIRTYFDTFCTDKQRCILVWLKVIVLRN